MAKKLIKNFLPHPDVITKNRWISKLGPRLQEPALWHINRHSCAGAIALGIFCACIPIPFQMLMAAVGAIYFRVNIIVAVPTVWLSNPITIPPIFYFCYIVGASILQTPLDDFDFELSWDWLAHGLMAVWQPFLLGCFIVGIGGAILGFFAVHAFWRYNIWNHIQKRRKRRHNRKKI